MKKRSFAVPTGNSCMLLGYYEGGYYEKCLAFYSELQQNGKKHPIADPRGYYSVLLSAYRLKDYKLGIELFDEIEAKKFWPSREVVYAVTEIFANGDFWREKYEDALKASPGLSDEQSSFWIMCNRIGS